MAPFDPYHKWLGIPPQEQPASYYRLLGIANFELDVDVIEGAAEQRTIYLRTFQTGPNSELAEWLLNEVSEARVCLLDKKAKSNYDEQLKEKQSTAKPPLTPPPPEIYVAAGELTTPKTIVQWPTTWTQAHWVAAGGGALVTLLVVIVAWVLGPDDKTPKDISNTQSQQQLDAAKKVSSLQRATKSLPASLKQGLIAYYPFNGNANDESGHGHHGTTMGGETFVADRHENSNQAFSSGSNNSYITVPDHNDLDLGNAAGKEMTISLWFNGRKENGPIHSGHFVTKRGIGSRGSSRYCDYYLWNSIGENGIIWGTGRSSATGGDDKNSWMMTGVIPPVGVWHHLVANYNRNKSGGKKVFLNGALIQQGGIGKKNAANNQPLKIGHWPGSLDDIRIYNRALSEAEVKALYEFERP